MKDYSNEIKAIKNGDKDKFNIILEDHKKMIYKIIYDRNLNVGDYMYDIESLYQEGCLALYKAVFTYEENKGTTFTSYSYMLIRSKINTYIRDNKIFNNECSSIDNIDNIDYRIVISSHSVEENPVEYHRELEFEKKLNKFISKLTPEDREIINMKIDNKSYKQISDRLKTNTKRVDNRLRILRKRLREYINDDGIS